MLSGTILLTVRYNWPRLLIIRDPSYNLRWLLIYSARNYSNRKYTNNLLQGVSHDDPTSSICEYNLKSGLGTVSVLSSASFSLPLEDGRDAAHPSFLEDSSIMNLFTPDSIISRKVWLFSWKSLISQWRTCSCYQMFPKSYSTHYHPRLISQLAYHLSHRLKVQVQPPHILYKAKEINIYRSLCMGITES